MADKVYEQTGDYIPATDGGFRDWLNNFSTLISADPGRYGLGQPDADIIANLNTQYSQLYVACQSAATRTSGLVTQKDAIKASAKATCRTYAQIIKANKGVDNQDKIQLGIHIDDASRTPIPAPASSPMLNIQAAFSGEHIIRFADENTPNKRGKPDGATQLELYVHVGPQPVVDWQLAEFAGVFTKNPIKYSFEPDKAGQVASYFARWRTAKGLAGPMSLGVGMIIAFGGPVEQQMPMGGTTIAGDGEQQLKIAA